ncbi:transposase, partial [Deferrisoma palaeochoriense]
MRRKRDLQLDLFQVASQHRISKEFEAISEILDGAPEILDWVHEDLARAGRTDRGREGMTAEQVLRSGLVKQIQGFTYQELEFHLGDSQTLRAFTRMRMDQTPSASTLHENLSAIREETWERINRRILQAAKESGAETGRK